MEIRTWTTHVGAGGLRHAKKHEEQLDSIEKLESWMKEKIYTESHHQIPDCYVFYPNMDKLITANTRYEELIKDTWNKVYNSKETWMPEVENEHGQRVKNFLKEFKLPRAPRGYDVHIVSSPRKEHKPIKDKQLNSSNTH